MGEMVEFPGDGRLTGGYLATAAEGAGLGVMVIPERGGLVGHIVDVCDRFAAEGFTALAPDPDHGETVPDHPTGEGSGARTALGLRRVAGDLSAAADYLQAHPAVRGHGIAAAGFGAGAGLALWLATLRPRAVRAVVPFYGIAPAGAQPEWPALTAAVEGHFAEDDDLAGPEAVARFQEELRDLGNDVRIFTYAGTRHAFFDDTRPEVYDEEAARQAWVRTLEFLRAKLG